MISYIESPTKPREVIWSEDMTSGPNLSNWTKVTSDNVVLRTFQNGNAYCPIQYENCWELCGDWSQQSNQYMYRMASTKGYHQIELTYSVANYNVLSGSSYCELHYTIDGNTERNAWNLIARYNEFTNPQQVTDRTVSLSDATDNDGIGIFIWANAGDNQCCRLRDFILTGITTPTSSPTDDPTRDPTNDPSCDPTIDPTINPSRNPTPKLTVADLEPEQPSLDPTADPSLDPTMLPSLEPTMHPSIMHTTKPTTLSTRYPTIPTSNPNPGPTSDISSTQQPSIDPTSGGEGQAGGGNPTTTASMIEPASASTNDNESGISVIAPASISAVVIIIIVLAILCWFKKRKQTHVSAKHEVQQISTSVSPMSGDEMEESMDDLYKEVDIQSVTTKGNTTEMEIINIEKSAEDKDMDDMYVSTGAQITSGAITDGKDTNKNDIAIDKKQFMDPEMNDKDNDDLFQPGPSTEGDIEQIEDDPLNNWLLNILKLPQYYDTFKQNGLETLHLISQLESIQDLEYIGITQKGHQIVIMNAIRKLNVEDGNSGDIDTKNM